MKIIEALTFAVKIKGYECRKKTMLDYYSYLKRFEIYINDRGLQDTLAQDFKKKNAIAYLDYVFTASDISAVTRNNHFRKLRALFFVLLDRELISKNPFAGVGRLRTETKRRRTFSQSEAAIVCNFLKEDNRGLLLAIYLCYFCGLRNAELRRLRIEDISLENGIITMDGSRTKNKNLANITIPHVLLEFMEDENIKRFPANYFLFGRELTPSFVQCGTNKIGEEHRKLIKRLGEVCILTDTENKTFYSWKDTGARDMIKKGITAPELMKHLRHSSLETTQRYLESFGIENTNIKTFKGSLF